MTLISLRYWVFSGCDYLEHVVCYTIKIIDFEYGFWYFDYNILPLDLDNYSYSWDVCVYFGLDPDILT